MTPETFAVHLTVYVVVACLTFIVGSEVLDRLGWSAR